MGSSELLEGNSGAGPPRAPGQTPPADLSPAQRRTWFLEQLGPERAAFQLGAAIRLEGKLDLEALRRAFNVLVARHRILRTTFAAAGAKPGQRVRPPRPLPLKLLDFGQAAGFEALQVRDLIAAETLRPFDLSRDLMLRAALLQRHGEPPVLVITAHELACDRPSLGRLVSELAELYGDCAGGKSPRAEEASSQYVDFARRQRRWLATWAQPHIAYWNGRLRGDLPALRLPTDRPRPAVQTFAAARRRWRFPGHLQTELRRLGQQLETEPWIVLLAAFKTLLLRYSGESGVRVGMPVGSPGGVDQAPIGPLANPLVLHTDLAGDLTFRDLVLRVGETVSGALAHREVPFAHLLEELEIGVDLSHHPLFQVRLVREEAPLPCFDLPALRWIPLDVEPPATQVDLTLRLAAPAKGIEGWLEYNPDLFDATSIARLASHLRVLAQHAIGDPDRRLRDLPLLPPSERHLVTREWGAGGAGNPAADCFHHIFERRAESSPEAPALGFGEEEWSYRRLNEQANRVAWGLRRLGIGPEARVGICLSRGPTMISTLLGILKAGGAYVPLDPTYPRERLAFMLQDARVAALLTEERYLDDLPPVAGRTLCLDSDLRWLEGASRANPPPLARPANLAYVMYTSGSTGRPKGTLVAHRGLGNVSRAQQEVFGVGPRDRVLQFAALSYDASIWEVVMALGSGASLHLAPSEELYPGPGLRRLLEERKITNLTIAPSALAALPAAPLPDLRTLIVAGEECPADLVRRWAPGRRFFNAYGPTESTIWATVAECAGDGEEVGKPPIGRPIAGLEAYVLDGLLQPLPTGVPGHLHLGGSGLARGYFDRPALTAESFVPHPWSDQPGARLYRTGDLARYLADGQIEFLGRLDAQVKLRGFRIELGEIEAVLGRHPAVRAAVALAREDEPGRKRLVAYIVLETGDDATIPELRTFLRGELPDFMVPTAFVVLDELPVMPSGKTDRRALPPPPVPHPETAPDFEPPRGARERRLAEVWARVLGVERVGRCDDFFDLGGDSILALQLIAGAREAGLELTPRQIFQHPTVAGQTAMAGSISKPRDRGPVTGEVALGPIQHWFFERDLPHPDHWNQAVLLEVPPALRQAPWPRIFGALMTHHDALRLRFERTGSGWRQWVVAPGGSPPVSRVDLSRLPSREQRSRLQKEAGVVQAGLNLSEGPIFRAAHFDLGEGRPGRLLVVIHHLAVDGVSWRILLEDLQTALRQVRRRQSIELPARTQSLREWSERLQELAASGAARRTAERWLDRQPPAAAPLPRDSPGGVNDERSARRVSVTLTAAETRTLRSGLASGVRLHEVLLGGLAATLADWSGSPLARIDVEGHGRDGLDEDDDLSRTCGWFTTISPLSLAAGAATAPEAILETVRGELATAAQDALALGVTRYLGPPGQTAARLARLPPAEVIFNYLGSFDRLLGGEGGLDWARGGSGPPRAGDNPRTYALEVTALLIEGRLRVVWVFCPSLHRRQTIASLARSHLAAVRSLVGPDMAATAGRQAPATAATPPSSLENREVEEAWPLTPLQQGMLHHSLLEPAAGIYHEQFALTLEGPLDPGLFRRAWNELLERHRVLRAACLWEGVEEPLQVVYRGPGLPWAELDWRDGSPAESETRFTALLQTDRRQGFDLASAPLLRLTLIATAPSTWRFLWSYHHLLLDGWSVGLLLEELLQLYEALADGREPLPSVRRPPFRAYVEWLAARDSERAAAFWRRTLGDLTAPTALDPGRPASLPAAGDHGFADREIRLPPPASRRLEEAARRQRLTLNTLVTGAWALLLSRYTGDEDVVFGSTIATRPADLDGAEAMLGLLINTLPVRVRASGSAVIDEWLQGLQNDLLELRDFASTPLVDIQGWSGVPRGQPLFESLLVFENYPLERSFWRSFDSFEIREPQGFGWTNYPLTVLVVPGAELAIRVKYDRQRFAATAVARLMGHFHTLLEGLASAAGEATRLRDVSLLTPGERHQLQVEWCTSLPAAPDPRGEVCVHRLFEARAASTPAAPALAVGDEELSYAELDARSERLAARLQHLGVGPETVVGLWLSPSVELVVAVLAVLKAGGAYLPLDPEHPVERVTSILAEARARVLIAGEGENAALPGFAGSTVRLPPGGASGGAAARRAPVGVGAGNLAYVIYTSGSSGRPKGVAVEHRQLTGYVVDMLSRLELAAARDAAMVQPLTVDSSVTALYPPLVVGGRVVVVPHQRAVDAGALARELDRRRVGALKIAPSHLAALVADLDPGRIAPRRSLVIGGEASTWDWVQQIRSRLPAGVSLFNHYGPTETTVGVLTYRVDEAEPVPRPSLTPLGRPIAGTRAYVLGSGGQSVPIGVAGELAIAGASLARGYLHQPRLTAERFLPDPQGGPGARLYRTGDLVRHLEDGNLEFVGRTDDQVKIRGFRIEPGEIEAVLRRHPAVAETRVLAWGQETTDVRLAAYVVLGASAPADAGELRDYLREKLPEPMVPAAFVFLDSLPRLPHGKVDRRALPPPDFQPAEGAQRPVPPRTTVEEILAGIWEEILGVDEVGVRDNFFELGGHSLMATRILSRIARVFGIELPLASLFDTPTVAGLAEVLGSLRDGLEASEELADVLTELQGISEEEAQRRLAEKP